MLKFCLSIDCEGFTSFKQRNPEWGAWSNFKFLINNSIKNFRYNKNGFYLVYNEIKKQEFTSTFMLLGNLFKPQENTPFIEWGYHTLNHTALNLAPDNIVDRETKNIYNVRSITAPMWRVEDVNNPERIFKILKKNGFRNTVYHGKTDGIKTLYEKAVRNPENRFGIKCVYVSNYFEGNYKIDRINGIKKDILNNLGKNAVYLLTTHDFTHRNNRNLVEIINFVKNLEKQNKIKVVNLNGV